MNLRRALARAAFALFLAPAGLAAQGYTADVSARGHWVELRGLARDSLPASAVPGDGLVRTLPDGTIVTCVPNEFCRWYPSGPVESVSLMTQDVRVSAWPGIRGLAAHVHVRGRYGSDDFWPRSEQEVDLLHGYVSYERGDFRVRGGRQHRTNGLGYYNFDGAAVRWRGFDPIRIEAYGGWSLARNLNAPRTGSLLEEADEFAPDDRGYLVGVDVTGHWGRVASAAFTYQREIREDELALYSERISGDLAIRLEGYALDLAADYDLAFEEFNEARLRLAAPLPYGLEATGQVMRYTPHFELWTIWGAFSPVSFDEVRTAVAWRVPGTPVRLEGGGAWRDYEEADAGAIFAGLEEDGWRAFGKASGTWRRWFAHAGWRSEEGSGAAKYGADASIGYDWGGGTYVAGRVTSSQSFSEFRLGEQVTAGGGIDAAVDLGDVTVNGSWAMYDLTYEDRPSVRDWTQQRAHLGVSYRFGSEPATSDGRGGYR